MDSGSLAGRSSRRRPGQSNLIWSTLAKVAALDSSNLVWRGLGKVSSLDSQNLILNNLS